MNCTQCLDELVAYLERLLGPEEQERVRAHLEKCELCRRECYTLAQLQRRLVRVGRPDKSALDI